MAFFNVRQLPVRRIWLALTMGLLIYSGAFAEEVIGPTPAASSSPHKGVVVTKDHENNISVAIDPGQLSHVQIKRMEGRMVILMQDDEKTPADNRLFVENSLKNNRLVDVSQRDKAKQVTINSDKVFLSIKDLTGFSAPTTKAVAKSPMKQAVKQAMIPVTNPAPIRPIHSGRRFISNNNYRRYNQTPPVAMLHQATVPTSKPKLVAKPVPIPKPAPVKIAAPVIHAAAATTIANPDFKHTEIPKSTIKNPEDAPFPSEPITPPAVKDATIDSDTQPLPEPITQSDPESIENQPLAKIEELQAERDNNFRQTMIKMIGSLILVLLLMVGFFQYVVPKIFKKFPEVPEKLKALDQQKNPTQPKRLFGGNERLAPSVSSPPLLEQFKVLSSTQIGPDRELCLVEIKGHQIVIAITPQGVHFVKELSDNPTFNPEAAGFTTAPHPPAPPEPQYVNEQYQTPPPPVQPQPQPAIQKEIAAAPPPPAALHAPPPLQPQNEADLYKKYLKNADATFRANGYSNYDDIDTFNGDLNEQLLDDYEDVFHPT